MKIKLIDFGGKAPVRAHYNDAGADVFACIPYHKYNSNEIIIPPYTITKVPLGFGLEMPDGFVGFVAPRSGMAGVRGITAEMVPVDSGYRGEIHAILHNTTEKEIIIKDGDKVAQLVIVPCLLAEFVKEDLKERGSAAFGSTGYR
jgi:dUTP pyrophosphatase